MSERGSYAKGVAKRAEILQTALEIVGHNGFTGATVRELAEAVGLSQNGLLHYFGSKDQLFTEILSRRDELDLDTRLAPGSPTAQQVIQAIADVLRHNAEVPGLVQLYSRISNEAAREDHPSHEYFRRRYDTVRQGTEGFFCALQEEGTLPAGADPTKLARMMIAMMDGLQTQWMYDEQLDMAEHVHHFFELMGVQGGE